MTDRKLLNEIRDLLFFNPESKKKFETCMPPDKICRKIEKLFKKYAQDKIKRRK